MNNLDTISAISTPPGMGAIAIIRISGKDSLNVIRKIFRPICKSKEEFDLKPRRSYFGEIVDNLGNSIDEVLVTYFSAPNSFTGEDVIEISCHGGVFVTKEILNQTFHFGSIPANPGEFSKRAFVNGKMNLTQAESIMDIISAQSSLALRSAKEQLSGGLGNRIEKIHKSLISVISHLEAYIDFPDEDITPNDYNKILSDVDQIMRDINSLINTSTQGKILRKGIRTVIAGAPNSGKSSLLNVLLKENRAIISDKAGTTRDIIEEGVIFNGVLIRIIDTAGIRDSDDDIEQEGIRRSKEQIKLADLIIFIIDSTKSKDEIDFIDLPSDVDIIKILNKSDLPIHEDWKNQKLPIISCNSDDCYEKVEEIVSSYIFDNKYIDTSDLVAINSRHQTFLNKSKLLLESGIEGIKNNAFPEYISMDFREALKFLEEIVGKTDVEDILGEIFSSFCIGK